MCSKRVGDESGGTREERGEYICASAILDLFHSGQVGWRRSFSASLDIWECIIGPDYALLSAAMLR